MSAGEDALERYPLLTPEQYAGLESRPAGMLTLREQIVQRLSEITSHYAEGYEEEIADELMDMMLAVPEHLFPAMREAARARKAEELAAFLRKRDDWRREQGLPPL